MVRQFALLVSVTLVWLTLIFGAISIAAPVAHDAGTAKATAAASQPALVGVNGAVLSAPGGTVQFNPSVLPVDMPKAPDDIVGTLQGMSAAVRSRQWLVLSALVLLALVWAARAYGSRWIAALGTSRGGAMLALGGGALFGLATAASKGLSGWAMLDGVFVGIMAAGGWSLAKNLLQPSTGAAKPE